jgi:hypothetical protein
MVFHVVGSRCEGRQVENAETKSPHAELAPACLFGTLSAIPSFAEVFSYEGSSHSVQIQFKTSNRNGNCMLLRAVQGRRLAQEGATGRTIDGSTM